MTVGACDAPKPTLAPANKLVVALRAGPGSWLPGPDGVPHGFEHDLIVAFAAEHKLPLITVRVPNADTLAAKIADGEAHVGIGGLYRPRDAAPPRDRHGSPHALTWTTGFHPANPVVIAPAGARPKRWSDLNGAQVRYLAASGLDDEVIALAREHPSVRFTAIDLPSTDALIAQVNDGRVPYALVSSLQASLARNVHLNFDVAFPAGSTLEVAWLVGQDDATLRERLDAFVDKSRRNGLIDRLAHRYFAHAREVHRNEAGALQERMRTVLPDFRKVFVEAQEASGIEWRLLAAMAYQESRWEPQATSETGVRGFMQLTEETARHLGVADRLDPRMSTIAAARYLKDLRERLPERIAEPDRTWLALAAFNIGLGHLEDARIIAQRQKRDPDSWQDVKLALPLLAIPEHYEKAKLGYARGGMPVAFVDRVRGYYDILLRYEPAHSPRVDGATNRAS
ncbi:MAG TPA: membrane-bound lytic murein transglycosylase MltF [Casimicrobiaceae bacterium]|nr:membrane-bound lytic murein transglycosylase MltF [Casimicrobiaceae bacterium]